MNKKLFASIMLAAGTVSAAASTLEHAQLAARMDGAKLTGSIAGAVRVGAGNNPAFKATPLPLVSLAPATPASLNPAQDRRNRVFGWLPSESWIDRLGICAIVVLPILLPVLLIEAICSIF